MPSDIHASRAPSQTSLGAFGLDNDAFAAVRFENFSHFLARTAAAEFAVVALAAYATSVIYSVAATRSWPAIGAYLPSALSIALLILCVSLAFRHYTALQTQPLHRFLWNGVGAVALAFSFFLATLFLLKVTDDYSRATFFMQWVAVAIAVLGMRAMLHAKVQAATASGRIEARRAVLIGDAGHHDAVMKRLSKVGVQTVRSLPFPDLSLEGEGAASELWRRRTRPIVEACRTLRPDDIVILASSAVLPAAARLADFLSELPVSLHMIPADVSDVLGSATLGQLGELVTIQLLHPPLSAFDRGVKRAFDIVAAGIGLALLSPVFAMVAIAIKLDSQGPVFFLQTRHGYNNEPIRVFKFRSMTTMEDGGAFRQAKKNDPRVTRVGRILRRSNVDELPQLLNVLAGEMSIVGPRPHPVALNTTFEKQISPLSRRHNVKPGITGWAQVNGYRGETDTLEKMQRRFEHDVYYIDNWSFILDVKIILMTLFSKSAYTNAF
jgi:Undecaprenyl-phosphate glucose phosphotransferase